MDIPEEYLDLYEKAKQASKNSYSPYSKYSVGAALKTNNGKTYTGTNIENASYGLTICAERTAISNCISNGDKNINLIAIYSESDYISPCGACRQFILEFGTDITVIYKKAGKIIYKSIKELLPDFFDLNQSILK